MRKLHRKAIAADASFDPRTEPTTVKAGWDKIKDNLESGMRLHILNYSLELRSIVEANIQQAFVDILDNDVIDPLVSLKVSQDLFIHSSGQPDNRAI